MKLNLCTCFSISTENHEIDFNINLCNWALRWHKSNVGWFVMCGPFGIHYTNYGKLMMVTQGLGEDDAGV